MHRLSSHLAAAALLGTMGAASISGVAFAEPTNASSTALSACDTRVPQITKTLAADAALTTANPGNVDYANGDAKPGTLPTDEQNYINTLFGAYISTSQYNMHHTDTDAQKLTDINALLQNLRDVQSAYGSTWNANGVTGDNGLTKLINASEHIRADLISGNADDESGWNNDMVVQAKDAKAALAEVHKAGLSFTNNMPTTVCSITTTATNKATGTQYMGDQGGVVSDTVHATPGWVVGEHYTITGHLMDQSTGKDTGITQSVTVTPTSADQGVTLDFTVPKGVNVPTVAFEYVTGETMTTTGTATVPIASDTDIHNAAETIYHGDFATTLVDGTSHTAAPGDTLRDIIPVHGYKPNHTYQMSGVLRDKATGAYMNITGTVKFTTDATGAAMVQVPFKIPATETSKALVAAETLYDTADMQTPIGIHNDLTNAAETVTVTPKPKVVMVRGEIDHWTMKTAAQVTTAKRVNADHRYIYREDVRWNTHTGRVYSAPLWRNSTWQLVTIPVSVPTNATPAQITAAENDALAAKAGVTANHFATATKGSTLVSAYRIDAGGWDIHTSWKNGTHTTAHVLVGSALR